MQQPFVDSTIKANYDELILNLIDRYGCDIIPADKFCPSFIENELAKDGISEYIPADKFCPSFIENELAKDGISE